MMNAPKRGWILREGYPFIGPPLLIGLAGLFLGWPIVAGVGFVAAVAVGLFFRNPSRRPVSVQGVALAPADGRVIEVTKLQGEEGDGGPGLKVSIFMSVLNVHVNRSPVRGEVLEIRHKEGGYLPAHSEKSSRANERNSIRLRMEDGKEVTCVQVAGVIARRIVCWVREGAFLSMGEPLGMIRFGSRVDCFFPMDFDPDIQVGQRVRGGKTILGRFPEKEGGSVSVGHLA